MILPEPEKGPRSSLGRLGLLPIEIGRGIGREGAAIGAEPAVQGQFLAAEIAGEDAVMHVMKVRARGQGFAGEGLFEAVMAGRRGESAGLLAVEEQMNRV